MLFQYDNVNGSIDDMRFDVLFNSYSAILARSGNGEGGRVIMKGYVQFEPLYG